MNLYCKVLVSQLGKRNVTLGHKNCAIFFSMLNNNFSDIFPIGCLHIFSISPPLLWGKRLGAVPTTTWLIIKRTEFFPLWLMDCFSISKLTCVWLGDSFGEKSEGKKAEPWHCLEYLCICTKYFIGTCTSCTSYFLWLWQVKNTLGHQTENPVKQGLFVKLNYQQWSLSVMEWNWNSMFSQRMLMQ